MGQIAKILIKHTSSTPRRSIFHAFCLLTLLVGFLFLLLEPSSAYARGRHKHHHFKRDAYTPPFSVLVVDGLTGRTLFAQNEEEKRHPASITKVMTLFLLFEQLDKGSLRLEDKIPVSSFAASQAPSKLGLEAGADISVDSAIRAIVTKSANDIAVAVAEYIAGSESRFAQLMTAKARSLGMAHTRYVNASGLPDEEQITTAQDLIILARALQERFPHYYTYFSTPTFNFSGFTIQNHNKLLGRIEGVDGIKTGYTHASGFNLLTSAKRGNQRLYAVILGGRSAQSRDRLMADLIEKHMKDSSAILQPSSSPKKIEEARKIEEEDKEGLNDLSDNSGPQTIPSVNSSRLELTSSPSLSPPTKRKPISHFEKQNQLDTKEDSKEKAQANLSEIISSSADQKVKLKETSLEGKKPMLQWVKGAEALKDSERKGVQIQIGATDNMKKAKTLLQEARQKTNRLSLAQAFTEKVQKGKAILWRARFAGLDERHAEEACKDLKQSGFICFTTRN